MRTIGDGRFTPLKVRRATLSDLQNLSSLRDTETKRLNNLGSDEIARMGKVSCGLSF